MSTNKQHSLSRMHALCAAVTTSFCPRHPALWIWPMIPLAALLPSCLHSPHMPSCTIYTLLFPCSHISPAAVHIGTCQLLPEATSSVAAMVWTYSSATFQSLFCWILLGGGSPYSTYLSPVSPFSSDPDPQSISCPTPFHL